MLYFETVFTSGYHSHMYLIFKDLWSSNTYSLGIPIYVSLF